jgi:hypothetical protein
MRIFVLSALAVATSALVSACASGGSDTEPGADPGAGAGVICTMEARSSFAVTVVDSTSGTTIRSGAAVRVTDGAFSDTLVAPSSGGTAYSGGVYERPGTYTVAVTHRDYRPWQRSGITVTKDECHVQTAQVTARLQKNAD